MRRPEPFQLALGQLRERLRGGGYAPGARIAAVEVADDLGLSATPVREALSRLAGEGLLEDRRGQGFFIRSLNALDIADLYRLSLAHLLIAQDPHRRHLTPRAATDDRRAGPGPVDPVHAVEQLFAAWVEEGAGRAFARSFRILQVQLGPVRRLEPLVVPDLAAEAEDLARPGRLESVGDRLQRLRRFHARRLRLAENLAVLLERHGADRPAPI